MSEMSSKKHWLTGQELIPVYQHVVDSCADKSREERAVEVEESNIGASPQVKQEPQDDDFLEYQDDYFLEYQDDYFLECRDDSYFEPPDDNFLEPRSPQQNSSTDQLKVLTSLLKTWQWLCYCFLYSCFRCPEMSNQMADSPNILTYCVLHHQNLERIRDVRRIRWMDGTYYSVTTYTWHLVQINQWGC